MAIPAVCFSGWSNSGKTTLIARLVRMLSAQGLRVCVIKHTHHALPKDEDGKDSALFGSAGASTVMLSAPDGLLMREAGEHSLHDLLLRVKNADIILIEGFEKQACLPVIEVRRDSNAPLRAPAQSLRAVVADSPCDLPLPVLSPDDASGIADFVRKLADEQRTSDEGRIQA